jgi:hypothetical protein
LFLAGEQSVKFGTVADRFPYRIGRGDPRFEALAEKIIPAKEFRAANK